MKIGILEIKFKLYTRRNRVLNTLKEKGYIRAIRLTKELTGWRLKESKEYVDRICMKERLDVNGNRIP